MLVRLVESQNNFFELCCAKHKPKRTLLRLFVPSRKPKEKTKQRRTRLPVERGHNRTSIETKKGEENILMQGWTSATECSVTHWRQSDSRKTHPAATAVAAGCAACLGLANKTNSNKMFSSFFCSSLEFKLFFQAFLCQAENQKNFSQAWCAKQKTKRTFTPSHLLVAQA